MTGFASPDVPAYITYLIVLTVGTLVAHASVVTLLEKHPDRWAFLGTWSLFFAYLVVPVALFWFLDYTGAVADTSLFAALVVAIGYQQIFAGGVQGIAMAGQTSALWKPFEAWVSKVADRIATKQKNYRDRFDESVRATIAADKGKFGIFERLVLDRSKDQAAVETATQAVKTARQKVDVLWQELRKVESENYGRLLADVKLISPWLNLWWLKRGRAWLITGTIVGLLLLVGLSAFWRVSEAGTQRQYFAWRLLKGNATDRDRFRTHTYFTALLRGATTTIAAEVLGPLLPELRYAALTTRQADDLLLVVNDCHSAEVDRAAMEGLIEGLRTRNPDVRVRIQKVLADITAKDFPAAAPELDLRQWIPDKDDSPQLVDGYVARWRKWFAGQKPGEP